MRNDDDRLVQYYRSAGKVIPNATAEDGTNVPK